MKKFKVQTILEYKKIIIDSDSNKVFGSMHQSDDKIKNSACGYWIVKVIMEHVIKIFECKYRQK